MLLSNSAQFPDFASTGHFQRSQLFRISALASTPVTRAGPIIVAPVAALLSNPLSAREYRSREVTREFQREHPCPSTGKPSGGCPGYRKDHIKPVACGGPRRSFQHAMADRCRREGQGPLGSQGVCSLTFRVHDCRTSPPIGIGGQPMPGGITTNSRTGFAASRPSAGFRIPSASCWISPGATMPEPIGSAAEPQTDDRRSARMGLVGDGRAAGVRNVAADYQALAPSAPSSCRSRARRFVMLRRRPSGAHWLSADLGKDRFPFFRIALSALIHRQLLNVVIDPVTASALLESGLD